MIDAAGAIYVIGGNGGVYHPGFSEVWASSDGGVRPDSVKWWVVGGYSRGYSRGYSEVLRGY